MKTGKEITIEDIKKNGYKISDNKIPKHIVCYNCGLERPLDIWLKEHGKNCKLPKLDINQIT